MKKTLAVLAFSVLAGLGSVSVASADTVIIHRHGYHHPDFHRHHHFHSHRTVIIKR